MKKVSEKTVHYMIEMLIMWTLCPWNSLGKNTEESSHSLLQGIFPTQGSNPGLLHCRRILYHLSHQGKPHMHPGVIFNLIK